MKKKVISILVVSMLFGSVVSAASIWGSYKGNQVIRITSNGSTLSTDDVPAISYNGRTMIPINMLGQLGLQYKWDKKNQTVDIKDVAKETTSLNDNRDLILTAHIYKELEDLGEELASINHFLVYAFGIKSLGGDSELLPIGILINNASELYWEIDSSPNAKKYTSTSPEIKKILERYESTLEFQKKLNDSISTMNVKPNASVKLAFEQLVESLNDSVNYGIRTSRSKYADFISQSTKVNQ